MGATVVFLAALLSILGVLGKSIPEEELAGQVNPTIFTQAGRVLGTTGVTGKGTRYNAYRGIPYAEPPVGGRRFASPVRKSSWSGVWDAREDANICVQGTEENIRGSEDCLYINVYAPENARNLAVMVWIYGGAFTSGDSTFESYNPEFLLDDNVVFVSFNYRLGIFGFISTEDTVISGNWGLKDQVLALQWVRENIESFGGDSSRITIFGESAGGASVSYLLQIPQASGLFSSAIVQSGNSENLWALTTTARHAAFQVGYSLGIWAILARTLLDRLRDVNAYELQDTAQRVANTIFVINPLRGLVWAPIIEAQSADAVFTYNSDDFMKQGLYPNKVPIMIGYTSNEAGHAHGVAEQLRDYLRMFDVRSRELAPWSLSSSSIQRGLAASSISAKYFEDEALADRFYDVIRFINIDQFARGTIRFAENSAQFVNVYFYVFGYMGQITGENPYDGAGHAEELFYLFKQPGEYSQEDLVVRDKLVRIWTNFAKEHNPTPSREALLDNVIWPRYDLSQNRLDYVWLNYTLSNDANPNQREYAFYEEIFNTFGSNSFTTY